MYYLVIWYSIMVVGILYIKCDKLWQQNDKKIMLSECPTYLGIMY